MPPPYNTNTNNTKKTRTHQAPQLVGVVLAHALDRDRRPLRDDALDVGDADDRQARAGLWRAGLFFIRVGFGVFFVGCGV